MDNNWKQMLETHIHEYVSGIKFDHPDFNINEFKEGIKKITNLLPAVKLHWNDKVEINQLLLESGAPKSEYEKIIENVQQVDITLLDPDTNLPFQIKILL